jgi:drug/metabolite transporter (DMT)-like permease
MFFVGLSKTTPGNAAIISLFEVCTSFLLFNVWAKETFSADYKLGAILMILGALIVLAPSFSHVNVGDSIIFISMFVAPLGNFYQQKARKIASAETMLFLRNVFSAAMVFGVTYLFGLHASLVQLRTSLPYLLINGVLILGFSKLFWIEGIHRISVTKGVAFNSAGPFITLLLAFVFLGQTPTVWQLTALLPLILGTLLLTDQIHLKTPRLA